MAKTVKEIIVFTICALTFFACDDSVRDCTIYNRSAYVVTYTMFDVSGELTIRPGETQVHTQTSNYPQSFSSSPNRVQYKPIGGKSFEFVDADPIQLTVVNKWPFEIKLSADNYLETDPLDVSGNSTAHDTIYISRPRFTVEEVPGYTIKINYSISDGTMYAVVE
jgi:hypothetical protein